jgi:hypothetical protein
MRHACLVWWIEGRHGCSIINFTGLRMTRRGLTDTMFLPILREKRECIVKPEVLLMPNVSLNAVQKAGTSSSTI